MMTNEGFNHFFESLLAAPAIAVDTETTGFNVKDGRDFLIGISVAFHHPLFGMMSAYFPFRHEEDNLNRECLMKIKTVLEATDKHLYFHNLKFDLFSLKSIGIVPKGRLYDTAVMAHLVNEEWPSKSLDWLSRVLLKDNKTKDEVAAWAKIYGWGRVPAKIMAPYAQQDAELTLRLFDLLWSRMKRQSLDSLWPIEASFTDVLYSIESTGLRVDDSFCSQKIEQGNSRMDAIESYLGFRPSASTGLRKFLLDELGMPKFDKFGNFTDGKPSFAKAAMAEYDILLNRDGRKEAQLVLEYRGWQKVCSSLYESVLAKMSPDGRVRASFIQHGTVTGRLSCREPNLQQIPRNSTNTWNGDAKLAFMPTEGTQLIEFDYSQLEFRLATVYGQDEILLNVFNNNEDPFIPTAEAVFGDAKYRQHAKTLTYSTLYGAGLTRLMNALNLSKEQATAVRDSFRRTYPGIYKASNAAADLAASRGYVRYWTGRRRHFSDPNTSYKAFNSVIQGGGAELVKHALIKVHNQIADSNRRIVSTVHDSILMEVAEGYEDITKKEVIEAMTDFPEFDIKFTVDSKNWRATDA